MTSLYPSVRWGVPLATTGLWALAAASVVFWGLRLSTPRDVAVPPAAPTAPVATPDPAAVARLLGAAPAAAATPAPEASSRFALLGVVADGTRHGAALISLDGKPPRPYRVGAAVGEGYVLQSVGLRAATLGTARDAPPAFTLQLPMHTSAAGVASAMPAAVPAVPTFAPPPAAAAAPPPTAQGMPSLPAAPYSSNRRRMPGAPPSLPPPSAMVPTGPIGGLPAAEAPQGATPATPP